MKIIFIALGAILLITIVFSSCGAGVLNNKAIAAADIFFKSIQKKDYATAVALCSDKAFENDTREAWIKALEKNAVLLGNIQSFTKTNGIDMSTSTTNGTYVTLAYDVQWQYGKSRDSIMLIKEKDGSMKVYNYHWQHRETKYMAGVDASEKQAEKYMKALQDGNYTEAIGYCAAEALKITPPERWKSFLESANKKMGFISAYTILHDSSYYNIAGKGESGVGNYYDVYIKSRRGSSDVNEKVIFYQQNYSVPVKLVGHRFL